MKIRRITEEDCRAFNVLRQENEGKILGYKQLVTLLKQSGIKSPNLFLDKMINYRQVPIIIKIEKGKYKMADKPVYIKALQLAWDTKVPKKEKKIVTLEDQIEDAILLLSDNGYKILKKVFDIERALLSPEQKVEDFIRWEEIL